MNQQELLDFINSSDIKVYYAWINGRWTDRLSFIRHKFTNYDSILHFLYNHCENTYFVNTIAYPILKKRVNQAIIHEFKRQVYNEFLILNLNEDFYTTDKI